MRKTIALAAGLVALLRPHFPGHGPGPRTGLARIAHLLLRRMRSKRRPLGRPGFRQSLQRRLQWHRDVLGRLGRKHPSYRHQRSCRGPLWWRLAGDASHRLRPGRPRRDHRRRRIRPVPHAGAPDSEPVFTFGHIAFWVPSFDVDPASRRPHRPRSSARPRPRRATVLRAPCASSPTHPGSAASTSSCRMGSPSQVSPSLPPTSWWMPMTPASEVRRASQSESTKTTTTSKTRTRRMATFGPILVPDSGAPACTPGSWQNTTNLLEAGYTVDSSQLTGGAYGQPYATALTTLGLSASGASPSSQTQAGSQLMASTRLPSTTPTSTAPSTTTNSEHAH